MVDGSGHFCLLYLRLCIQAASLTLSAVLDLAPPLLSLRIHQQEPIMRTASFEFKSHVLLAHTRVHNLNVICTTWQFSSLAVRIANKKVDGQTRPPTQTFLSHTKVLF